MYEPENTFLWIDFSSSVAWLILIQFSVRFTIDSEDVWGV